MNKNTNWLATTLCAIALFTAGVAHGAASTFEATLVDNDAYYDGTVKSGGDGYAFTAEDSARYYKFLNLYASLLLDGAVCAGSTNWHTVTVGSTWSSGPSIVTITNGARMVTKRNSNIQFKGKGGTIVVSEPTARNLYWASPVGNQVATVLGNIYTNMIGTVGLGSKFTLTESVTSDTGTNDILRLLPNGTASYHFVSNQNASVAARILFEGGEMRSISESSTKFQVADGATIVLQCVDGNPIRLRTYGYDYSLFAGPGTFATAGDGDFVLLQHSFTTGRKKVTLAADAGGSFAWGHAGRFVLGGLVYLQMGSDDVLPHGPQTGLVFIDNNLGSNATYPLVIDLNGTSNTVNGIAWPNDKSYRQYHVVTNSSATVATLGLDVSSNTNLSAILNAKFAGNAPSTINLRKVGAGTLSVDNAKAVATLATNACLQVAEGIVSFDVDAALVRPLAVEGGAISVAAGRTLDLSAISDADLSVGGLAVDAEAATNPTITKFRPAANGTLRLTDVEGKIDRNYTVPITLTTVVDPANFESWSVEANGEPVRFATVSYANGVLRVLVRNPTLISIR